MNEDDQSSKPAGRPPADAKPGTGDDASELPEPFFADFDDEDLYEEPDRDTDYASAYEEGLEDDAGADPGDEWTELEPAAGLPDTDAVTTWQKAAPLLAGTARADELTEDLAADEEAENFLEEEDNPDEWDDSDEEFSEEDFEEEFEEEPDTEADGVRNWPLGLMAVAVIALLLLAAGGYGVIQQRSAMQEEIRQLQASLATAASPAEVAASREALQEMNERTADQVAAIDALTLDNRRLQDVVAGLEAQLEASQARMRELTAAAAAPKARQVAAPTRAAPTPATPEPRALETSATAAAGTWFVNFGSYSKRALAESWARKLQPAAGRVIVAAAEKNGSGIYRVRVIGLASREQAEQVSRQLESQYKLPKLWLGKQS